MKLLKTKNDMPNDIPTAETHYEAVKKNILIVDDSGFARKILKDMLESEGFNVVGEAGDGFEAIEMAKQKKPDLIFMDVAMPKLDGMGALPRILEMDPNLKVIMSTAMGKKSIIVEAMKIGAIDYVLKPYKKENISEVLNAHLESEQKNSQVISFEKERKHYIKERVRDTVVREVSVSEESPVSVAIEEAPESVVSKESLEAVSTEESLEAVSEEASLELIDEGESLEAVIEGEKLEASTDGESLETITDEETLEMVAEEESLSVINENESRKTIAEEEISEIVSEVESPTAITGEETLEAVLDSETASVVAGEEALGSVSEPETASAIAEEETLGSVSESETVSAIVEEETLGSVSTPETASAIAGEETLGIVPVLETESVIDGDSSPVAVHNQEVPAAIVRNEPSGVVSEQGASTIITGEETHETVSDKEEVIETVLEVQTPNVAAEEENTKTVGYEKHREAALGEGEKTNVAIEIMKTEADMESSTFSYLWENRFDSRHEESFANRAVNEGNYVRSFCGLSNNGNSLSDQENSEQNILFDMVNAYMNLNNRFENENVVGKYLFRPYEGIRLSTNRVFGSEWYGKDEISISNIVRYSNYNNSQNRMYFEKNSLYDMVLHLVQAKADRILGQDRIKI